MGDDRSPRQQENGDMVKLSFAYLAKFREKLSLNFPIFLGLPRRS